MALLAPKQRQFAAALSQQTGLDPRVVGSWLLAEQSGSAARYYEGKGYNNWLNIARTDSGDASGAHSAVWRNPLTAAKATAEWLQGRGQIAKEYGKPAAGIQQILRAGRNPAAQINAIASSGWASSGYNGGSTLRQLYGQLGGETALIHEAHAHQLLGMAGGGGAAEHAQITGALAKAEPQAPSTTPADLASLLQGLTQQPQGPTVGALPPPNILPGAQLPAPAPIQPSGPSSDERLNGLLGIVAKLGQGTPESPAPAEGRAIPQGYAPASHPAHAGGKLAGLLPGNALLKLGRIDEGQDGQTNPGGPIVANGNGIVVAVKSDPGGFGPSYPVVVFKNGPLAGHGPIYFGHTLAAVKQGQAVAPGQVISHTGTSGVGNATVPGWFEIGLANTLGQGNRGQGARIAPVLRR